MAVKLLGSWGGQPAGTLFYADAATEASMVATKVATSNLAGGVPWTPPGNSPGVGPSPNPIQPAVLVQPTGTVDDPARVQAAAVLAMRHGATLRLAPGDFNFTVGGVVADTGPDLLRGGVAGNGYKALKVEGAGKGDTRIYVGAGQKAFLYANASDAIGLHGGVSHLSIIGPGIGSGAAGVQFGGRSALRSDLLLQMHLNNVAFDNVTSCFIGDDVSVLTMQSLRLGRFKFGFEWSYNMDTVQNLDLFVGHDESPLNGAICTIINGQSQFTVSGVVAGRLQVGYGINAKGAFPPGTYVGNVVGTTVTAVNFNGVPVPATANSGTVSFYTGRVFCFGTRVAPTAGTLYPSQGSSFVSPYWSTVYGPQSGRLSGTNHHYQGLINEVELVSDIGGGSHFNITHELYTERISQMARLGDTGSNQQPYGVKFVETYAGFADRLLGPWIEILAAEMNFGVEVKGCHSDTTVADITFPWVRCDGYYGNARLTWEDNNLQRNNGRTVQLGDANVLYAAQPSVPYGGAMYMGSARKGDAIQTWIDPSWHYYGQDGMEVPLAGGSRTINNPASYSLQSRGKEFTIYLTAQSGNTLTLGTMFKSVTGANLGTIAAGTTGQRMALRFTWDGFNFVAQQAPAWV